MDFHIGFPERQLCRIRRDGSIWHPHSLRYMTCDPDYPDLIRRTLLVCPCIGHGIPNCETAGLGNSVHPSVHVPLFCGSRATARGSLKELNFARLGLLFLHLLTQCRLQNRCRWGPISDLSLEGMNLARKRTTSDGGAMSVMLGASISNGFHIRSAKALESAIGVA